MNDVIATPIQKNQAPVHTGRSREETSKPSSVSLIEVRQEVALTDRIRRNIDGVFQSAINQGFIRQHVSGVRGSEVARSISIESRLPDGNSIHVIKSFNFKGKAEGWRITRHHSDNSSQTIWIDADMSENLPRYVLSGTFVPSDKANPLQSLSLQDIQSLFRSTMRDFNHGAKVRQSSKR